MAGIDDLMIAVQAQINGHTFSPAFFVDREDVPVTTPGEIKDLRVTMIPQETAEEAETRSHDRFIYAIEICFERKAGIKPQVGDDPIVQMSMQIRRLQESVLRWLSQRDNRRPPTYKNCMLKKLQHFIFDADTLRDKRTHIGAIRLTYEEIARPT